MDVRDGFTEAVGNTPLIKLRKASKATGCTVLGKAEFMNPGGSVKDRAALYIVRDAEARGALRPGGVIVEGTAGNTGIGLALVGNARGYRTVVVIPQTQSQEKKDALRLCGAELREVPAAPYSSPDNYVHVAERLAGELARSEPNGVLYANQWDNLANREGHVRSTGPEIWRQTDGRVDGFVCSVGTGGTLAGVGLYLKARHAGVRIAAADPMGAGIYHWVKHGELRSEGSSITEGIGQNRITRNLEGAPIDDAYQIGDAEALPLLFDLLKEEGLCLGGSSGINVAGAIRLARDLGPGHTVVTILADSGTRYQSKLYNLAFLRGKSLPVPAWLSP
ncbi:cysteine synthase A [Ramlibacter tataouinensis]|uniref:cysteine synthase A n=1 Tax=Ramlibacter tataouinensis TaxID=94132 RepID=UPI0022F3AC66|nr:cysteine synthase A [Ramlibacter tataouinensis]WBY01147.1 cysteine synthase A [Ramlibacter tataouinensis]